MSDRATGYDRATGDTEIRATKGRVLQARKPHKNQWTAARQAIFFETLALTCHVQRAADVAEMSYTTVFRKRRADPVFAERWRQALVQGYDHLERELLRLALETVTAVERTGLPVADGETEGLAVALPRKADGTPDVQLALTLLKQNRGNADGRGRGAPARRRATPEEVDAALRRQLDLLGKRLRSVKA